MREIPVTEVGPVHIRQTENTEAATGCTVVIAPEGMRAGLDVRGGGPASRESQLLNPLMAARQIHAIVLAGGSAYGLGAANGVMQYLEEHGIGYDTGYALVPLVAQSDIYDLSVGDSSVRPDAAIGYEAARSAMEAANYADCFPVLQEGTGSVLFIDPVTRNAGRVNIPVFEVREISLRKQAACGAEE